VQLVQRMRDVITSPGAGDEPCGDVLDRLKPGLWSRSRRLGLETVSRRTNVSSRSHIEKNCQFLRLSSDRL